MRANGVDRRNHFAQHHFPAPKLEDTPPCGRFLDPQAGRTSCSAIAPPRMQASSHVLAPVPDHIEIPTPHESRP